ncbi:MAG TPA: nicotinate-nucleotide adenylyltransferase [Rhizobacter sp.]|nr:nicotinate-nucleotide adenylyltransferase [Rhizobacter sp.]
MKRIGLFGGSFDPVHSAHVALARLALSEMQLDELRWIPAGQPWQKARELASPQHREAMVRLAIQGEPRFVLDRCELQRRGPSFTLDTVRELQVREPGNEWFLILGQDQYAGLHTWRDWRELLSRVTLAVANRPGTTAQPHAEVARAPHRVVALPMMDVSSTEIRQRVAAGQGIDNLVPAAVASYIAQHHLYRGNIRS